MQHSIVRCKHCGNHYSLQVSGYGYWDYNADRNHDYCPDCYALIKDELEALDNKLNSKELKERFRRYKHAYVPDDSITEDEVLNYWNSNWGDRGYIPKTDGWGYIRYPGSCGKTHYIRNHKVYKKYLIDTKDNKVVDYYCTEPYDYKDNVCGCTNWEERNNE